MKQKLSTRGWIISDCPQRGVGGPQPLDRNPGCRETRTSCLHTFVSSEDIENNRNLLPHRKCSGGCWYSAHFLLFRLVQDPRRGVVLPTLRRIFPLSSLEHSYAPRCVSQGIPNQGLVSMRMNHQGPRSPQPFKKDSKPFNTIPHQHFHLELCPQLLRKL